jgi:hypothetical protein
MPLTELQIKALTPEAIRYAVSDGRGLALEVLPTGAASWVQISIQGKDGEGLAGQVSFCEPEGCEIETRTNSQRRCTMAYRRRSKNN